MEPECGDEVTGDGKDECERLMKDCWHSLPTVRPQASKVVQRLEEILEMVG